MLSTALLASVQTGVCSKYSFRHYTDGDGLSSNTIQCLYQDSKGYIWVGTKDGLDRFDSHDFTNYRYDYRRQHSIANNSIFSVCSETTSGKERIWVGTNDGLYMFDSHDETFVRLPLAVNGAEKNNVIVYTLCADIGGNLWIGTLGAGLFRYGLKSGTLERYGVDNHPETFTSDLVSKVLLDYENNVWVASGSHIHKYRPETNGFSSFRVEDRVSGNAIGRIGTLCQDSFGDIWICGNDGELFKFDISGFTFTAYLSGLDFGRVRAVVEYTPGTIMMGTENGLVGFDIKSRSFEILDDGSGSGTASLKDKFIHAIIKDRNGGLWIGTYFGGLNYLSPLSSLFTTIEPPSQCGKVISRMCEDTDGNIWIGSDDGGLSMYDPRSGAYRKIVFDPLNPSPNIHALLVDGPWLWIGTYGSGLYRMDVRTRRAVHFTHDSERTDKLDVYSLLRDSGGTMWIGTKRSVCIFDEASESVVRVADIGENRDVVDIKEDFYGNVWFASLGGGLMRRSPGESEITQFSHDNGLKISDYVSCLMVDNNWLWIGTHGNGICRYNISDGSVERDFDNTDYTNCAVFQIIPNGREIWMTTNKGLLRYRLDSSVGSITGYIAEDGLLANIFNPNSGMKSSTGYIYIGSNKGINAFYPYDFTRHENSTQLRVIFPDVRLFDRSLPVVNHGNGNIDDRRSMKLVGGGWGRSITIDFIAINYASPTRTTYRYMLENFDEEWSVYGGSRLQHVSYTNLRPGHYRFVVSATDGSDPYGEPSALDIEVVPPFYASQAMILLYFILASAGTVVSAVYIVRKVRRRHQVQIESIIRKNKMDILETRINLFRDMANEIRTPVSLISSPLEEVAKHPGISADIEKDINTIRKNCDRLLSLVDRVLDLQDSELTGNAIPSREEGEERKNAAYENEPELEKSTVHILDSTYSSPASSGDKPRVLLVEWNSEMADFFTRHLSSRFEMTVSPDAKGAMEVLLAGRISAVLVSTGMQESERVKFISEIRGTSRLDHLPLVVLSSDTSQGSRLRALRAGADACIEKPLTIDHIVTQLEALLESRKQLRLKFSRMPYFTTSDGGGESGSGFMERVDEYIVKNISNSYLSVEDIAEAIGMGRSKFFAKVKSITGTTPNEYLRLRRLKSAAELLSQDNGMRINEISYAVGFSSTSYFSKCFLVEFGLSPNEFREKYHNK